MVFLSVLLLIFEGLGICGGGLVVDVCVGFENVFIGDDQR